MTTRSIASPQPLAPAAGFIAPPSVGMIGETDEEVAAIARRYTGFDDDWLTTARTRRRVRVRPFELARAPVTNSEFAAFVDDGGYAASELWSAAGRGWLVTAARRTPKFWRSARWSAWVEPAMPVVGVTVHEAEAYAAYVGARLPTEDEWELAAGGGIPRRYPWGDHFGVELANTADRWIRSGRIVDDIAEWQREVVSRQLWNDVVMLEPAATSTPSADGFVGMSGNAWEWMASRMPDAQHVVRGGSFAYLAWNSRVGDRGAHPAWWSSLAITFRCARDAVQVP